MKSKPVMFLKCPCLPIQVDLPFIFLISFLNDSKVRFYSLNGSVKTSCHLFSRHCH